MALTLADLLKEVLTSSYPQGNDNAMVRSPSELGGSADNNVQTPDAMMQQKATGADPGNVINDKGAIVDYAPGNPFSKLMQLNGGAGTMTGFLHKLLDNPNASPDQTSNASTSSKDTSGQGTLAGFLKGILTPDQKGTMEPQGTVGGGATSDHVPGTQQDAALNPTPLNKQRAAGLNRVDPQNIDPATGQPAPITEVPKDYSIPTALNPQQIEELRQSLLTQAGQRDPTNPNGLAGRMSGLYGQLDQRAQYSETQNMADNIRGFDGSRSAKIKQANRKVNP